MGIAAAAPITSSAAWPSLLDPSAWQVLLLGWVATLLAVALALVTAYLQVRRLSRDITGVGRKVDAHDTALALHGAGRTIGQVPVPPAWNQLADPTSSGALPAQRTTECGEECAAMVCYWRHRVPVDADYVRYLLRGADGTALTTAADVERCLQILAVRAVARDPAHWPEARGTIRTATAAGRPVAVLINLAGGAYKHWILAYSSDETAVHYNDPWGGLRVIKSWEDLAAVYAGALVEVLDHADP